MKTRKHGNRLGPGRTCPVGVPVTLCRSEPALVFVLVLVILLSTILIPGCSEHRCADTPIPFIFETRVNPNLILNASGRASLDPQLFAYRRPWPATEGGTRLRETTRYRQVWYNRQTLWPNRHDHSFKLFRSYRKGTHLR